MQKKNAFSNEEIKLQIFDLLLRLGDLLPQGNVKGWQWDKIFKMSSLPLLV